MSCDVLMSLEMTWLVAECHAHVPDAPYILERRVELLEHGNVMNGKHNKSSSATAAAHVVWAVWRVFVDRPAECSPLVQRLHVFTQCAIAGN